MEGLALWSIFEGMNIHKIQVILMRTEGVPGFDPDGCNIDPNMVSSFKGFPASKEFIRVYAPYAFAKLRSEVLLR